MGYTTEFNGEFTVEPKLKEEHIALLEKIGGYGPSERRALLHKQAPPDSWCQWVPSKDGTGIRWDGGEKFYHYLEWLRFLISEYLVRWGYRVNGRVQWRGEEWNDTGTIVVVDNDVKVER